MGCAVVLNRSRPEGELVNNYLGEHMNYAKNTNIAIVENVVTAAIAAFFFVGLIATFIR